MKIPQTEFCPQGFLRLFFQIDDWQLSQHVSDSLSRDALVARHLLFHLVARVPRVICERFHSPVTWLAFEMKSCVYNQPQGAPNLKQLR